jgi:hypothetical protein
VRIRTLLAVSFLALLAASGCTETRYVAIPADENMVKVSGVINGWYCGVGHDSNFPYNELKFAPHTGELPSIRFLYNDGAEFAFDTDSASAFNRILPLGEALVIVETRYGRPDTFQCVVQKDTSLVLDIVYETLAPDSMLISFEYPRLQDSLLPAEEWAFVRRANILLQEKLLISPSGPLQGSRMRYEISNKLWIYYSLKVQAGNRSPFEVVDELESFMEQDVEHQLFPASMQTSPTGNYICHQ